MAAETPDRSSDDIPGGQSPTPNPAPDDATLVAGLLAGDGQAARQFIERYDRLVRYTIFRTARRLCEQDPGWLDAVANESWAGIVRSLRRVGRHGLPANMSSYIAQTSRNKCLDAVKKAKASSTLPFAPGVGSADGLDDVQPVVEAAPGPLELLENLEQVESLRDCLDRLGEDDRLLCAEIELILERRWKEAAERLGIPEATLRTRWPRVLVRLRNCLERKTGKKPAPPPGPADS